MTCRGKCVCLTEQTKGYAFTILRVLNDLDYNLEWGEVASAKEILQDEAEDDYDAVRALLNDGEPVAFFSAALTIPSEYIEMRRCFLHALYDLIDKLAPGQNAPAGQEAPQGPEDTSNV